MDAIWYVIIGIEMGMLMIVSYGILLFLLDRYDEYKQENKLAVKA